jgi:hypothetical protein
MQNHQIPRNTSEPPHNDHQSTHSTDAFTGRDSACPRREKAPTGQGEGFWEATNIAAILSRELRFCLTFCVIVYCIAGVLV